MALHDEGIRFTEEHYATKDDVKKAYNMSMIDSIWDKVLLYRSNFLADTGLINIDHNPFSLTLYRNLTKKISNIERKIFQTYVRYNKEGEDFKKIFNEKVLMRFFIEMNYGDDSITEDMMLHIIRHDIGVLPANVAPLCAYQNTLEYFKNHEVNINKELLLAINGMVAGESYEDSLKNYFRSSEIDTPHYFQKNYIYKAAPLEELDGLIDNYLNFLNDEDFSPLLKSIISFFYFDYIKPFDYQLEETSSILAKVLLSKGFEDVGFLMLTEGIGFDHQEEIRKVKKIVQETGDLTYFVVYYLDVIDSDLDTLMDLIEEVKIQFVKEEQYKIDEPIMEEKKEEIVEEVKPIVKKIPSFIYDEENIPKNLVSQGEVALPVFPTGVEKNAIGSIVQNLMEIYPYLKKTQAHFYALHCTIGKHYTIAQFKKEEDVAYETARTSMDFLADSGFYKKSQIRNKFVYTPIPRR